MVVAKQVADEIKFAIEDGLKETAFDVPVQLETFVADAGVDEKGKTENIAANIVAYQKQGMQNKTKQETKKKTQDLQQKTE